MHHHFAALRRQAAGCRTGSHDSSPTIPHPSTKAMRAGVLPAREAEASDGSRASHHANLPLAKRGETVPLLLCGDPAMPDGVGWP